MLHGEVRWANDQALFGGRAIRISPRLYSAFTRAFMYEAHGIRPRMRRTRGSSRYPKFPMNEIYPVVAVKREQGVPEPHSCSAADCSVAAAIGVHTSPSRIQLRQAAATAIMSYCPIAMACMHEHMNTG